MARIIHPAVRVIEEQERLWAVDQIRSPATDQAMLHAQNVAVSLIIHGFLKGRILGGLPCTIDSFDAHERHKK